MRVWNERDTAVRAPVPWQSLQSFGSEQLDALCHAVGFGAGDTWTVRRTFERMCGTWGPRPLGENPAWRSDITDDHTPFELSLALEQGQPEVRFLLEAQGQPTTLRSSWEAGLALNAQLHREWGVPLERFEQVKELFEPVDARARFGLWHAVCVAPGDAPAFKVYLNPFARGPEGAEALVRQALERLGCAGTWRFLSTEAMRRGRGDQPVYFSLDLSSHRAARIKVYLAHRDATAEDIDSVMSLGPEYVPGESRDFCQRLQGATGRFLGARPTLTCLSFTSDEPTRPSSVTLHFPIRCYAAHDADALQRIRPLLDLEARVLLERSVRALARRPLEAGVGLLQWVSLRRQGGGPRATFYLATEAYGGAHP
jgi:DMATS type aromatic prenyltransferase